MQRGGNRLRVNVQLIDAETGNHLWAERFDKPVADLFDMQDEIVSRLANTLDAELIAAEARRAERSPHPDAMDLVFQGSSWFNKGLTPDYMAQARSFSRRPLRSIPKMSRPWSVWRGSIASLGAAVMTDDWSARFAAAETTITKALSLAPNHALAHAILGFVQIFTNRAAQGIAECEQALTLDRNLARAHALIGLAKFFLVGAQKPNLTSTRHSAFLLATPLLLDGWYGSALPRRSSVPMPKRSSGCAGASTQTGIIPSRISISRLHSRGSESWTKRGLR